MNIVPQTLARQRIRELRKRKTAFNSQLNYIVHQLSTPRRPGHRSDTVSMSRAVGGLAGGRSQPVGDHQRAATRMTPADLANVVRLRELQSEISASLNAIVSRISDSCYVRPSADQWTVLWPALKAANVTLQVLADERAVAHARVKEFRRRLRDVSAVAGKTEAS